jgi:hypothetical protein
MDDGINAFYPVYSNQGSMPSEEELVADILAEKGRRPRAPMPAMPGEDPFYHQHTAPVAVGPLDDEDDYNPIGGSVTDDGARIRELREMLSAEDDHGPINLDSAPPRMATATKKRRKVVP